MRDDLQVIPHSDVHIAQLVRGPLENNVYLLTNKADGGQIVIDAAADAPGISEAGSAIQRELGFEPAHPATIVTTHSHADHTGALPDLLRITGASSAAGAPDAPELPVVPDLLLADQDTLPGPVALHVIALRGHTPGSIALVLSDPHGPAQIFTGDSLFPGGLGNTGRDPHRFDQLYRDVTERIFDVFGDDTLIHPGHGRSTTLGAERPQLAQWRSRGW